jgi:hypothetical protein
MRGPGADLRVIARTVQGMARVRSGQGPARPGPWIVVLKSGNDLSFCFRGGRI